MEYFKDMARPTFSNNITWDLKESDIMYFTNQEKPRLFLPQTIKVKLVISKDNNLNWLPK
jgi:hypothetical protein